MELKELSDKVKRVLCFGQYCLIILLELINIFVFDFDLPNISTHQCVYSTNARNVLNIFMQI